MAHPAPSGSTVGRRQSSAEPWSQGSLRRAREVAARLAEPAVLGASVERLSELLLDLECTHIRGASPMGHLLANAVARKGAIALAGGTPDGRLAIVDGVITTGVNLVGAMREERALGANDVVGVALVAQAIAISAWAGEGEIVRALEVV